MRPQTALSPSYSVQTTRLQNRIVARSIFPPTQGSQFPSSRRKSYQAAPVRSISAMGKRLNPKELQLKELSTQLASLKMNYNKLRDQQTRDSHKLQLISYQQEQFKMQQEILNQKTIKISDQVEKIRNQLVQTKQEVKNQLFNKEVVKHIYQRMRQTKIHLELKSNLMKEQCRKAEKKFDQERRRELRSIQLQRKGKMAFQNFVASIKEEKFTREEEFRMIEGDYQDQQKIEEKRVERMEQALDIAEAAANEDRNKRNLGLRNQVFLHRLWHQFLSLKLQTSIKSSEIFVKAFNDIKSVSGIPTINDVVQKFMTRQQNYLNLQSRIKEAQAACKMYKKKIKHLQKEVHLLSLQQRENKPIKEEHDLVGIVKSIQEKKGKLNNLKSIEGNIKRWAVRVSNRLSSEGSPSNSLRSAFSFIQSEVSRLIKETNFQEMKQLEKDDRTAQIDVIIQELQPQARARMTRFDKNQKQIEENIEDINLSDFNIVVEDTETEALYQKFYH